MNRLKGLAATLLILALLAGLPAVLLALGLPTLITRGGNPLQMLLRPDDGTLLLTILWAAAWIVWAYLTITVVWEILAGLGRIRLSRPRSLPHTLAHHLVSTAALLFVATSSITPTLAHATPTAATVATHEPAAALDATADQPPSADEMALAPATVSYVVQPGDSLWRIAERHLGAGERYGDIVALNHHLLGGKPDFLKVGWTLTLPAPADHQPDQPTTVTVQKGDTLTKLATRHLGDPTRWPEMYQASTSIEQPDGRHLTNPDEIDIGWTLAIPTTASHTIPEPAQPAADEAPSGTPSAAPTPTTAPPADLDEAPEQLEEQPAEPYVPATPETPADATGSGDTSDDEVDLAETGDAPVASWVVAGLAGGGLLCGSLALGLSRRRIHQAHHRRPGRAIQPTPATVAPIEKTITTRPQARIDVEELEAVLWWTAEQLATLDEPVPTITAVAVSATDFTLHLAGPRSLPAPWQVTVHPTCWQLDRARLPQVGPDRIGAPAWPQLTTIGIGEDGTTWLLNLEAAGVITLTGDPTYSTDLIRHIVAELALNPWARDVQVDCLDICDELVNLDPIKIRHHSTDTVVAQARADAQHTLHLLADSGAPTLPHARVTNAGYDLWASRAVIVGSSGPTEHVHVLAGDLLAHQDRPTGTSLILTHTETAADGVTEVHLTTNGRVHVPQLGWDLIAVGLTGDEAQGCATLIAAADNLDDTAIPATTGDAVVDQAGNLHTIAIAQREPDAPNPGSLLPEPDEHYLARTATTSEDLNVLAPPLTAALAEQLQAADPTLDDDLAEWLAGDGPRPRLSVLGPVHARVGQGGNPLAAAKRKAFYTELLAYLWAQPHGATTAQVTEALGITEDRARRDLSKLREWLGAHPHTGHPHLPPALRSKTGQRLGVGIYEVNDLLTDADLFKRLRTRAHARGEAGIADLDSALSLVQGTPFTDLRPNGGAWLIDTALPHHLTCAIVDTAHLVTTHALAQGDIARARRAVDIANRAAPHELIPQLDLAAIADATGHHPQAHRVIGEALDPDPDEAPFEPSQRTRTILANRQAKLS